MVVTGTNLRWIENPCVGSSNPPPDATQSLICVRGGTRVRFYNIVDLVSRLEAETLSGLAGRIADHQSRLDLVILDELG